MIPHDITPFFVPVRAEPVEARAALPFDMLRADECRVLCCEQSHMSRDSDLIHSPETCR